jgi:hypothetical protein
MVADQVTHRVTVTPSTPVEAFDNQVGTGVRIGAVTVEIADWHGDAGIIAAAGSLIDAIETCRSAALERERRRIRGSLSALPDGVEFAGTVGQFLDTLEADWANEAPGTFTEAWGR